MNNEMSSLSYNNLIGNFIVEFPEFNEKAKPLLHAWYQDDDDEEGDLLAHIFFGSVINPFLKDEAFIDNENSSLLNRFFGFLERMATSEDAGVLDVLNGTVLERLGDNKNILNKAQDFMGVYTFITSLEIEFTRG